MNDLWLFHSQKILSGFKICGSCCYELRFRSVVSAFVDHGHTNRSERDQRQLDVLDTKRNANDRHKASQGTTEVTESEPPARNEKPNHIAKQAQQERAQGSPMMLTAQIRAASHHARAIGSPPRTTQRTFRSSESIFQFSRQRRRKLVTLCESCLTIHGGQLRNHWMWLRRIRCRSGVPCLWF